MRQQATTKAQKRAEIDVHPPARARAAVAAGAASGVPPTVASPAVGVGWVAWIALAPAAAATLAWRGERAGLIAVPAAYAVHLETQLVPASPSASPLLASATHDWRALAVQQRAFASIHARTPERPLGPPPRDDGAAAHLPGTRLPPIALPSTAGGRVALSGLAARTVVFAYPSIGIDPAHLDEWTAIPGARGCTPEACGFRDHIEAFATAGVDVVGLSGQPAAQQRAAAERLGLPYPLLSDEELRLSRSLGLPTFEFRGSTYLKRLTLVVSGGTIETALYPVFPPDQGAEQALRRLAVNPDS